MADEKVVEELEKSENTVIYCKRCGQPVDDEPLKVDQEVLEDYLRASLAGKKFEKTYKIAGGRIQATFEDLPAQVADKFNDIMRSVPADRMLDTAVDYKLALILKLVEFITEDGTVEVKYDGTDRLKGIDDLPAAVKGLSSKFDETMMAVLRRVSLNFVILLKTISDNLLNSDFYTGVGLR